MGTQLATPILQWAPLCNPFWYLDLQTAQFVAGMHVSVKDAVIAIQMSLKSETCAKKDQQRSHEPRKRRSLGDLLTQISEKEHRLSPH